MSTFADRVIDFNENLHFEGELPPGIRIMNPFRDKTAIECSRAFYQKFYNDKKPRRLILGINPGRFGAGITGIAFTDPKRLVENCGIPFAGPAAHEPSSVFIYEMIAAYGGPTAFYGDYYITSICPLGFTSQLPNGREVNYNYYDSSRLINSVYDFMLESTRRQLEFGIDKERVFCFGTGKNEKFIRKMNEKHGLFGELIPLEHPRYIMQYRHREKEVYVQKYLDVLRVIPG